MLTALFNIGDDLTEGRQNAFNISVLDRAYRLARWTLTREINHDARVRLFTSAETNPAASTCRFTCYDWMRATREEKSTRRRAPSDRRTSRHYAKKQ